MNTKNVFLRKSQYRFADEPWFCLWLARKLVAGKIRNQRTMLLRNHIEVPKPTLRDLKSLASRAEEADKLEELLSLEGAAARIYFGHFSGMLKADNGGECDPAFTFDFQSGNRRPQILLPPWADRQIAASTTTQKSRCRFDEAGLFRDRP